MIYDLFAKTRIPTTKLFVQVLVCKWIAWQPECVNIPHKYIQVSDTLRNSCILFVIRLSPSVATSNRRHNHHHYICDWFMICALAIYISWHIHGVFLLRCLFPLRCEWEQVAVRQQIYVTSLARFFSILQWTEVVCFGYLIFFLLNNDIFRKWNK